MTPHDSATAAHSAATQLAEQLAQDIQAAKTREEHVRVTARANEAARIAELIRASLPT